MPVFKGQETKAGAAVVRVAPVSRYLTREAAAKSVMPPLKNFQRGGKISGEAAAA
jgi:hypothetical protein